MPEKLKVGDTLWWVPDLGEAGEVVVKEVGRKWAVVSRPTWGSHMEERIDFQNPRYFGKRPGKELSSVDEEG